MNKNDHSSAMQNANDLWLSLHFNHAEASGLAELCHLLEWEFLTQYPELGPHAIEIRCALAKMRFALSDAGFYAMPGGKGS